MVIDENWAVSEERLRKFFGEQDDVEACADGFRFRSCCIALTAAEGTVMGKWAIARTRVQMSGGEEDVKAIYQRFFLRFLSAGG